MKSKSVHSFPASDEQNELGVDVAQHDNHHSTERANEDPIDAQVVHEKIPCYVSNNLIVRCNEKCLEVKPFEQNDQMSYIKAQC